LPRTEQSRVVTWLLCIGALPLILLLWVVGGHFALAGGAWLFGTNPETLGPGETGDMFGAVNALFSGFAFWGVAVALYINALEYRLARLARQDDLDAQKEIARAQYIAAGAQRTAARAGDALSGWIHLCSPRVREAVVDLAAWHRAIVAYVPREARIPRTNLLLYLAQQKAEIAQNDRVSGIPARYRESNKPQNARVSSILKDAEEAEAAIFAIRPLLLADIYPTQAVLPEMPPVVCRMLAHHARRTTRVAVAEMLDDVADRLEKCHIHQCPAVRPRQTEVSDRYNAIAAMYGVLKAPHTFWSTDGVDQGKLDDKLLLAPEIKEPLERFA